MLPQQLSLSLCHWLSGEGQEPSDHHSQRFSFDFHRLRLDSLWLGRPDSRPMEEREERVRETAMEGGGEMSRVT